uniref:Putative phycoerythrobilin lyase CpeS n=2 Tax=Nostocales TaxID=1161 RepID=CPES_MICDP|nr:RecName: Full=Putative phycoerythrobilin lyase CpeS [Microchaete diplosiphon]AAK11647.1 CpeS [Tolypothrix sp. PCC 7601]ABP99029.1 CpeS [Fremyella diplosiphon Fd33]
METKVLMNITKFVANSIGHWRSQRSAHHLAFGHFEAVQSEIDIIALPHDDPAVIDLCKSYNIDPQTVVSPFRMTWEGQSDWDDSEIKGTCVLVPIPDPDSPHRGKLLRSRLCRNNRCRGDYYFTEHGTFVLVTAYERAAAEEKIWFVNPNVRCLCVSLIKTSVRFSELLLPHFLQKFARIFRIKLYMTIFKSYRYKLRACSLYINAIALALPCHFFINTGA